MGQWYWHAIYGTVVLASYIWDSGTGILYMGQWYWHPIYETVVLASYIWDSGTGILYIGQWYWHPIYGTVVLASYTWAGGGWRLVGWFGSAISRISSFILYSKQNRTFKNCVLFCSVVKKWGDVLRSGHSTGSSFYLTAVICHISPLLGHVCGWPIKWALFIW